MPFYQEFLQDNKMKRTLTALLIVTMTIFLLPAARPNIVYLADSEELRTDRSLDMLNEIIFLGYVAASSNSTIADLDKIYDRINTNLNLNLADPDTQYQISNLLGRIEDMRMVEIKRERLETIYNFKKSEVLAQAVPNPINLMGTIYHLRENPVAGIASLIGTAASSKRMYDAASDQLSLEMLQQEWELDDQKRQTLTRINQNLLEYASEYAYEENLDTSLILNNTLARDLAYYSGSDNLKSAIQVLEGMEPQLSFFPTYWLEMADLYFRYGDWAKCLQAIDYYEANFDYKEIYRQNFRYAQILVDGVSSCLSLHEESGEELDEEKLINWLEIIDGNTAYDDWLQRYFVATCYLMFADEGNDYARLALMIVRDNIARLRENQLDLNRTYINDIPTMTRTERKADPELAEYYDSLRNARATELPSTDPALLQNLRLFYLIVLSGMAGNYTLHEVDYAFDSILIPQLKPAYYGQGFEYDPDDYSLSKKVIKQKIDLPWSSSGFSDFAFTCPASMLNDQTELAVRIGDSEFLPLRFKESGEGSYAGKVTVDKVDRDKSDDPGLFTAELTIGINKELLSGNDASISIMINTADCPVVFEFIRVPSKKITIYTYAENGFTAELPSSRFSLSRAYECTAYPCYYNQFQGL